MRKLFFVPIIHSPADMGTLGIVLSDTSAAVLGRELWDRHSRTISLFWESIARFFLSDGIIAAKIYQDGLVAAGADGLKIVNEGVKKGSINFAIISALLQKGAALIQTEDIALVQKEYSYLKKITSAGSNREKETALSRYKLAQTALLADRDKYIAGKVESTLKDGETGVLFIGAYHEVLSRLPADINIVQVKDLNKVRQYHHLLSNFSIKTRDPYQQLADYLAAPVPVAVIERK
jgi:hypothetical protein